MTLKTGRRCTWGEIKVGEVFARNGCWEVCIKNSSVQDTLLASTLPFMQPCLYGTSHFTTNIGDLYKLPKSTQKLWKEEL